MSRLRSGKTPSRCTSMNRGEVTSGRTAATAGLYRSVCPTARIAPDALAAAISSSASASDRAIGFSTSTDTAALEKRHRNRVMQLRRHRDGHRVDVAEQLAGTRRAPSCPSTAATSAARSGICVDDRRRATRRRASKGCAHDAGRDDRRQRRRLAASQPCWSRSAGRGRPTMAMPASLADAKTCSPSSTSVRPASTDSAAAPAVRIA